MPHYSVMWGGVGWWWRYDEFLINFEMLTIPCCVFLSELVIFYNDILVLLTYFFFFVNKYKSEIFKWKLKNFEVCFDFDNVNQNQLPIKYIDS